MSTRARITGTGMAVPECVVDNHLLSRCMSTTDEWIFQRTGIRERRVSPDTYQMLLRLAEAPDKTAYMREVKERGLDGNIDSSLAVSDLGLEASRMALKHAGLGAEDLDCIVETSTLPDLAYPGTGCVLQGKLGLTSTPVFNLAQGCAGFVYGLSLADQFIRGGMYRKVLVVGAELLSSAFDYTDAAGTWPCSSRMARARSSSRDTRKGCPRAASSPTTSIPTGAPSTPCTGRSGARPPFLWCPRRRSTTTAPGRA
jgi:3-oxoacyl-[acyl-carrier-protein] synthase-3